MGKSLSRSLVFVVHCIYAINLTSLARAEVYKIDIANFGANNLEALKKAPQVNRWVEAEDTLYLQTSKPLEEINKYPLQKVDLDYFGSGPEYLITGLPQVDLERANLEILAYGGRTALVRLPATSIKSHLLEHAKVTPAPLNIVLSSRLDNQTRQQKRDKFPKTPTIRGAIAKLNIGRWLAGVETLSSFNRYTENSSEMVKTTAWLTAELKGISGLEIRKQEFNVRGSLRYNIIGVKHGTSLKDHIIIGAHYDSISERPNEKAPGAEDNGSGTAAVLEVARALATIKTKATIHFAIFGGEEQGLFGSKKFVQELTEREEPKNILGVITLDMIGFSQDEELDVLIETAQPFSYLITDLQQTAEEYTKLRLSSTFNYWGSDHVPFLKKNIPAVLLIENDYAQYPNYHRSSDTIEHLNSTQAHEVLKLSLAQILNWSGQVNETKFSASD